MSCHENAESNTRFVPWFNMAEWDETYKQIYSDDTVAQVKGFERLLVWKARCPEGIPVGAQCTLDLIQVCLKDREVWPQIAGGFLPPYHERDLRFMYAMAVLRFLNHLAALAENKPHRTLYDVAAKLHIPDWVVNIRHDTSHGHSLPSLSVLREATQLCLDWIHEHYWKNEAEMTADWTAARDTADYIGTVHQLKEIVETWQAVMLYSSAGLTTLAGIPDLKLRRHLINEKKKFTGRGFGRMIHELRCRGRTLPKTEMAEAQILVIKKLKDCMEISGKFGDSHEILVDVLLEGDGFLASLDFLSMFSSDNNASGQTYESLPADFRNFWKTMLYFLNQYRVIPVLVEKLIHKSSSDSESHHRSKMAALWVNELLQSLCKVKKTVELVQKWERERHAQKVEVRKTLKQNWRRKQKTKQTAAYIYKRMGKMVENLNPHLKGVMPLRIQKLPRRLTALQLLREAILKPSPRTITFLPCLMELVDPPLPEDTKEKTLTLVNIYAQEPCFSSEENIPSDSQVYTVHNLKGKSEVVQNEEMDMAGDVTNSQGEVFPPMSQSHWTRYKGLEDWGKCPFGRLPWQNTVQLEFPCDSIWQPCKQVDDYSSVEKNLPGFFHEKVNWDEVLSKRPRPDKYNYQEHERMHVVERAFTTISHVD